ncbi:type I-F CRISPR-associated protein Csy2, partial [Klebsiella pneumoniae]|nr:type I-F CRISPR-associated protein Csy2 [Klebsiella pneumoniae]
MRQFLLIPHLKIHNANAMSSPYTIGFPAMTAWLGAVHALQRKLHSKNTEVELTKIAVSCHDFNLQNYKGRGDFVHSIVGTANPLDKDGNR